MSTSLHILGLSTGGRMNQLMDTCQELKRTLTACFDDKKQHPSWFLSPQPRGTVFLLELGAHSDTQAPAARA